MTKNELEFLLRKYNDLYRRGMPEISDELYDHYYDMLYNMDPENSFFTEVGMKVTDDRKVKLPIEMRSMNKIKTIEDLYSWCKSKSINENEEVVITPKYDGISLLNEDGTNNTWTRGDGIYGQNSNEHYKLLNNKSKNKRFEFTYGEVIMPRKTFEDKYKDIYKNPRNLVAGLLNSKEPSIILNDCHYIKYGAEGNINDVKYKHEILDILNEEQDFKVNYIITTIDKISIDFLVETFTKWSSEYEIDGLIIEINSLEKQRDLGRETSSRNPCYARAFKSNSFEEIKESEIIDIKWNISKQGYLKPVLNIQPIILNGVKISNITGNNAKYVVDMGLGIGAIIKVRRSGMVIPIVEEVIKKADVELPKGDYKWSLSGIELETMYETDEQRIKQIISFFNVLGTKSLGEGNVNILWNNGYRTIKDILNMKISDFLILDGFALRKSEIIYNNIQDSIRNVPIEKLQHASGLFPMLGEKKLALVSHFSKKPTMEQLLNIDGFAEISAKSYLDNYDRFFEFVSELPIVIRKYDKKKEGRLLGEKFVFSGLRDKKAEEIITENGGEVVSTVSKKSTYLVVKEHGSSSSKELLARKHNVRIITIDQFYDLFQKNFLK